MPVVHSDRLKTTHLPTAICSISARGNSPVRALNSINPAIDSSGALLADAQLRLSLE